MTQISELPLSDNYAELKEQVFSSARQAHEDVVRLDDQIETIDRVGELAISGVTIENGTREELEEERTIARSDAAILGSIAVQIDPTFKIEAEDDRPTPTVLTPTEPVASGQNGSKPERQRSGMSTKVRETTEEVIKNLVSSGGAIQAEGKQSATSMLIDEVPGLTQGKWQTVKTYLADMNLVIVEKATPTAKRVQSISIDPERLSEVIETGEFSEDLKDFVETAKKEAKARGETDFLALSR